MYTRIKLETVLDSRTKKATPSGGYFEKIKCTRFKVKTGVCKTSGMVVHNGYIPIFLDHINLRPKMLTTDEMKTIVKARMRRVLSEIFRNLEAVKQRSWETSRLGKASKAGIRRPWGQGQHDHLSLCQTTNSRGILGKPLP